MHVHHAQAVKGLGSMGICGMVAPGGPGQTVTFPTLDLLAGKQFKGIIQGDSVSHVFIPQLIQYWLEVAPKVLRALGFYNRTIGDDVTLF